jgi:hypothetical protein
MKNLRTLVIRNGRFNKGPTHLPNSLRVLEWWRYPSMSLPADFHPKKLVILKLPESFLRISEPIQASIVCLYTLSLYTNKHNFNSYDFLFGILFFSFSVFITGFQKPDRFGFQLL